MVLILEKIYCLIHRCPTDLESIYPCSCKQNQERHIFVKCSRMDYSRLTENMKKLRPYVIDFLEIHDLETYAISKGIFSKLWIHDLTFKNCKVDNIDLFYALDGLHDSLNRLTLYNFTIDGNWGLSLGNHFIHLEVLKISKLKSKLDINEIFTCIPKKNLIEIELSNCGISQLKNESLKKFHHLEKLVLNNNSISFMKRDTLPRPALHLKYYELSNNPITALADDMFLDMPRLKSVNLSGTSLTTLPLQIFMPVWDQLEEIYLNDISLTCDCYVAWMLVERKPTKIEGPYCYQPKNLQGMGIYNLSRNQLCTF